MRPTPPAHSSRAWLLVILLIAAAYRLPGLDVPIIGEHAWRQADTASMARNFYRNGYDLLRPQVDWSGDTTGEVESEFPLYPYLVALLYGFFGPDEAWARGLSVLFSLLTVVYLYALARSHTDERTALWASAFFAILPLTAHFGRAVMPEPLMLFASVAGLHHFSEWTRSDRPLHFAASMAFVSLAALLKLPALYLGLPIGYLAWLRFGVSMVRRPSLWFYGAVVLGSVTLWYAHAHQLYEETGLTFGIWGYGTDKWGNWGLVFGGDYWERIVLERMARDHLTWFGFVVFTVGLFMKRKSPGERIFDVWMIALLVYLVLVGVGNYAHNYYQLPLLLPAVVFMAKPFGRFFSETLPLSARSLALGLLLIGIVVNGMERIWNYREHEDPAVSPLYQLAKRVAVVSKPGGKVLSLTPDPSLLYLADRKGWRTSAAALTEKRVNKRMAQGALYVAGLRKNVETSRGRRHIRALKKEHELLFEKDGAFVVRLRPPPEGDGAPEKAGSTRHQR